VVTVNESFGEDDKYFATCFHNPDTQAAIQQAIADSNPLLPLIERAATHICALQVKIQDCGGPCLCACDYDDPGDVCTTHGRRTADPHQSAGLPGGIPSISSTEGTP
jgi:hypothetical protein